MPGSRRDCIAQVGFGPRIALSGGIEGEIKVRFLHTTLYRLLFEVLVPELRGIRPSLSSFRLLNLKASLQHHLQYGTKQIERKPQ